MKWELPKNQNWGFENGKNPKNVPQNQKWESENGEIPKKGNENGEFQAYFLLFPKNLPKTI